MSGPKIIAFAGSAREGSFNKMLARTAAGQAEDLGAEVTLIDLNDYPMPVYHGDDERRDGTTSNGRLLRRIFIAHDGFLIASPEHNGSVSALLKNTFDWVSRADDGFPEKIAFAGKVAGIMGCTTGYFGALRQAAHLRDILSSMGTIVLPERVNIPNGREAFDPDGNLVTAAARVSLEALVRRLVFVAERLRPDPTASTTPSKSMRERTPA
jgi:chromate reductase, NAD(P)H dehydrogenase (quinone)